MNLRFVEAFYWVATLQSVTRAAEKLCLTQSAMSSRIAALESELGVLLLDRRLRRVRLTVAGTRFLVHARSMLELMREARLETRSVASRPAPLRLGAIESVMQAWLIPWTREIGSEFPELSIEFSIDSTLALQEQMLCGALDVAFAALPSQGEGIRVRSLPEQEMVFLANAKRYRQSSYTLEQLAGAEFMTSTRGSHSHVALLDLLRQHRITPGVVHAIRSLSAMAQLAEDGYAIAVLQKSTAESLVRDRCLRVLTPSPAMLPMSLFASYRVDAALQTTENVVRSAVAFIKSRMRAVPLHPERRFDDATDPSPASHPVHS